MIDLSVSVRSDVGGKKVVVSLPFGSYFADFGRKNVVFYQKSFQMYDPDIRTAMRFDENELSLKPNCDGVLHYFDSIDISGYDYKVEIEYLNTENGKIEMHSHPKGVEELYVSAEKPYHGEICKEGESHKPWATKTVAVKIIKK